MNINRNNYEEYFLLFADNELSTEERKEVEIFVENNPDLKEEFNLIKLTINFPDEKVSMADKSFLMKNLFSSFINENNYKEIFILYHDHELSAEQKIETEDFLEHFPQFKTEFKLFEKAKLTPDSSIIFPDKKQLYRKEKTGKVIPLIFWRAIAAAVFIGFGLWFSISFIKQKNETPDLVIEKKPIAVPLSSDQKILPEKPVEQRELAAVSETKTEGKKIEKDAQDFKERKRLPQQKESKSVLVRTDLKNKKLLTEESIPVKNDFKRELVIADNPIKSTPDRIERIKGFLPTNEVAQHTGKSDENSPTGWSVQQTSYVGESHEENEDYIFYNVKMEEFNKTKIGGFLKKVKRTVERNNPIGRLLNGEEKQIVSK